MDDLISRQVALDALGERPVVWSDNDDYTLGKRNQYDMDRLAIETVPFAQPGWIPCSEGLPKLGTRYNVTYESGEVGYADFRDKVIYGNKCVKNVWDIPEYYEDDGQVVAWMPLPTPYREGGQDG